MSEPAILVASAGDPIPAEVLARVRDLAGDSRPPVIVVSVARIWGTALGLPNPGLYPTRQEMEQQREHVAAAATALVQQRFHVETDVLRARNAGKAIARYAEKRGCRAVLIADPRSTRWQRIFFGDVSREIKRRTSIQIEPVGVPVCDPRQGARRRQINI
jgi:nucleotide-binding universal stress UspA family protein